MSTTISIEQVTIERIDDIPLLVALQQRVGLAETIDQIIPPHWLHQGLSLGQLIVGWNTFILSQADHRKVTVSSPTPKAYGAIGPHNTEPSWRNASVPISAIPTSQMTALGKS